MLHPRFIRYVRRLQEVYGSALTVGPQDKLTTVNELTDQLPAMRWDTLEAASESFFVWGSLKGNVILTEEDKGSGMVSVASIIAQLPLAMARWYTYDIPRSMGAILVPIKMEYHEGKLLVNGLKPGDKVTILDDTLSTGGTLISLIDAVDDAGAEVVEIRVVTEKIGYGGREKIKAVTGIDVLAFIGIQVQNNHVEVVEVMHQKIGVFEASVAG